MFRILVICSLLTVVWSEVGYCGFRDGPIIAVHLQSRAIKGHCTNAAPTAVWCDDNGGGTVVANGALQNSYDAFHVLVDVNPSRGLREIAFGIYASKELGIFGWTSCADEEFPDNGWPQSGGGNRLVYDDCQNELAAGDPEGQAAVVLGTMYLYAYASSGYVITPRGFLGENRFPYRDCNDQVTQLRETVNSSSAGFGSFGGQGCGLPLCSPVELHTWSSLKQLLADESQAGWQPN